MSRPPLPLFRPETVGIDGPATSESGRLQRRQARRRPGDPAGPAESGS